MWTCPKCASKVDSSFEICWSCGTSVDGVEDPSFVTADAEPPSESPLDLDMPEGEEPVPAHEGELVECYWALDLMQAKFLADKLSEAGIPAVADTHDMREALGSMSSSPRVWVSAEDLENAQNWLEDYDRQHQSEHGRNG